MANSGFESGPGSGDRAFERERAPRQPDEGTNSIAELVGGLIGDAQTLVRKEVELARQELAIEANKAKQGAVTMSAGLGAAVIGGILLGHSLALLLQDLVGLALWVSYLIVGAVLAIVGGLLFRRGSGRLSDVDPVPRETVDSVRKDVEWIREQSTTDRT